MTRFDAATEETRRELFADAIRAHDERSSPFLTIETDVDDDRTTGSEDDEPEPTPWIQFADGTINLDCTDDEHDRIASVLDDCPELRVDELARPEDAEGVNLKIAARTDPERVAEFIDRIFREAYDRPADYRAWVTAV